MEKQQILKMFNWGKKQDSREIEFEKYKNALNSLPTFHSGRPLMFLSPVDPYTIGDSFEGIQVFGATGSGKSSGSGKAFIQGFLREGYGGLVMTAKPEEFDNWAEQAELAGRLDHIIEFSLDQPWRFNFLDYELNRPGGGAGLTENLVNLFLAVLEIAERKQGSKGDDYWQRTLKQLLRNAIDLVIIAKGKITLMDLYEVITTAPQFPEEAESERWRHYSTCFQMIRAGEIKSLSKSRKLDFEFTSKYWLNEFAALSDRTRSIIVSMFTSMADCFLRGPMRELFCTTTNLVPELSHEGAIIILNLPIKEYSEIGQYAQVLFKYIWHQATERRNVKENPRPVFLWADESQYFVTNYDMQFQTTARSSKASTVYLTQNLPNYYSALGGSSQKSTADSLLGNLNTKIFHANGDSVTNNWAAELFAKSWQYRSNINTSINENAKTIGGRTSQRSMGTSESLNFEILPQEFTMLRKGGFENDLSVDSIVFQGGRKWRATDKNFLRTTFKQD